LFGPLCKGRGVLAKQQKRHVQHYENSAAPHTHAQETNIEQHSACGENRLLHMETGAESNANGRIQHGSQTVLWQIKNLHIPKREKATFLALFFYPNLLATLTKGS
jgi:hypothetical protein